jgi:hypothetical protein
MKDDSTSLLPRRGKTVEVARLSSTIDTATYRQTLERLGFPPEYLVAGRSSIADLVRSKKCGLYVLRMADGSIYAGQSVNIADRYVDHRRTHGYIEAMTFRSVPARSLDQEETALIRALEGAGLSMLNIVDTSSFASRKQTGFGRLIDEAQQRAWAEGSSTPTDSSDRSQDPEHRLKYRKRYEKLLGLPHASSVLKIVELYGREAVPLPKATERAYWSISCLPYFPKTRTLVRVNVNWQEVFAAFQEGRDVTALFMLPISDFTTDGTSNIKRLDGDFLARFSTKSAPVEIEDFQYRAGGADQFRLWIPSARSIVKFMTTRRAVRAVRYFNLNLMRKGANPYSSSHCYDLADHMVR